MISPAPRPNRGPRRAAILDVIEVAVQRLDAMVGRWFDAIPAEVRAEISEIREPLETVLISTGLSGQQRGRRP